VVGRDKTPGFGEVGSEARPWAFQGAMMAYSDEYLSAPAGFAVSIQDRVSIRPTNPSIAHFADNAIKHGLELNNWRSISDLMLPLIRSCKLDQDPSP
jgi:hypothetical protein